MIVEDELISRNLLKKMLEEMGHDVLSAADGVLAWELFQKSPVQVIIADWMMPNMDGLELCRKIRSVNRDHYVYITILTAKDDREDLLEVFNAGADDYITKPFDPEELRARIKTSERVVRLENKHHISRKNAAEKQDSLRLIVDALDEEIVAIDRGFNIIEANRPFLLTKFKSDAAHEIVRRPLFEGAHEFNQPPLNAVVAQNARFVFERGIPCYHLDQTAGKRPRHIGFLPIKNMSEKVTHVVIVIRSLAVKSGPAPPGVE